MTHSVVFPSTFWEIFLGIEMRRFPSLLLENSVIELLIYVRGDSSNTSFKKLCERRCFHC